RGLLSLGGEELDVAKMGGGLAGRVVIGHLDEGDLILAAAHVRECQAVNRQRAVLDAEVVVASIEGLRSIAVDREVAVNVTIVVRMIDAVDGAIDREILQQHRRRLNAEGVVNLPDLHAADDERVASIGADAVYPFAEVEAIKPVAMSFVVV